MKQRSSLFKNLGIAAAIFGFFWVTQPLQAEIEDTYLPTQRVEKEISVAIQVCRTSACNSHGSGFHLWNGYFITAAHVTRNRDSMWVKNSENQQQEAKVMWVSKQNDFTLMFVKEWSFLSMPTNSVTCELQKVGEQITIVGYPAALGNITTKGVILKITENKKTKEFDQYIVEINAFFGFSGGPAINTSNEVFGIVVGGLLGTQYTIIEPMSKICGLLPTKKENDNGDK